MGKELFVGTFVHSLSLEELEVSEKSAIGVENGKIVFVEKKVTDLETVKKTHGFQDAKVCVPCDVDDEAYIGVGDAIEWESVFYSWVY